MSALNVDPRLSEFSADELNDVATAISIQIEAIETNIERVTKYPELSEMYAEDIIRWKGRLENLRTFEVQLINAEARKEIERRMISN